MKHERFYRAYVIVPCLIAVATSQLWFRQHGLPRDLPVLESWLAGEGLSLWGYDHSAAGAPSYASVAHLPERVWN
jgi:hypothetical protein